LPQGTRGQIGHGAKPDRRLSAEFRVTGELHVLQELVREPESLLHPLAADDERSDEQPTGQRRWAAWWWPGPTTPAARRRTPSRLAPLQLRRSSPPRPLPRSANGRQVAPSSSGSARSVIGKVQSHAMAPCGVKQRRCWSIGRHTQGVTLIATFVLSAAREELSQSWIFFAPTSPYSTA
jgi:hypothetical protein